MQIITEDLFIGEYKLPKSCFKDFGYYIEKYEREILLNLFGAAQYDLFIADLSDIDPIEPQNEPYITAFNPFRLDDKGCLFVSDGIKVMCTQYIYFHIQRDLINSSTNTGVARMVSDNSENLGYKGYQLVESYNDAIGNFNSILWYLCENEELFPDLNSQHMNFISGI